MIAVSADTFNSIINSLTALLIAAGGLGLGRLVKRGTGKVAQKTEEAGQHIVDRLDSMERNIRGLHHKVNGLTNRVEEIEVERKVREDE